MPVKECDTCHQFKGIDDFEINPSGQYNLTDNCKECIKKTREVHVTVGENK